MVICSVLITMCNAASPDWPVLRWCSFFFWFFGLDFFWVGGNCCEGLDSFPLSSPNRECRTVLRVSIYVFMHTGQILHTCHMNCYVSLLQVLGPNILSWVCPTSRHIGSGLRFRTAYDNLTGALTSKWSWSLANFGIALVLSVLLSVKLQRDGWVLILWWWVGWAACRSPSM